MFRLFLCFLFCLAPLVATAQDTPLKRLTLRHDMLGWEAVGRLDIAEAGFCSAALIAPDLVLTAAHCLISNETGERIDPGSMTFRAGLRDGKAIAERKGARAVVDARYLYNNADGLSDLVSDIGLVQLESAIPAGHAAPFALSSRSGKGQKVTVVSYARGRDAALSWQRSCRTTFKYQGALGFTCDTDFGSSGAPIFETSSGRPRIVSLVSRITVDEQAFEMYGMEVERPVTELRRALRSGRGVWSAETGSGNRVGPAWSQSDGSTTGARFVRP